MKDDFPADYRQKVDDIFKEAFYLAFNLLKSVYVPGYLGDNLPYQATKQAQSIFNNPTGIVEVDLNNLAHQVWGHWIQVNVSEVKINIKAPSNCVMHEIWILLMAVQERNIGNLT